MTGRGRAIYCEDKLWNKAKRFASARGYVSVSDWIRTLIEREIANYKKEG